MKQLRHLLIFSVALLLASPLAFGADESPVQCKGDKVEYLREQQIIRAEGNVILAHNHTKLTSDKAVVFVESGDAYANGHVVLTHENRTYTGEKMHYNFKSGLGDVVNMDFVGAPWFAGGETGKKVSSRELILQSGTMTTCDLENPHYKMKGREIRIYPGDRVVLTNMTVTVWDVPVLWFPRYTYPLNDERSRFIVVPGYRSDFGFFLLTGYNFYQTEHIKGTLHLDERVERGFGVGVDVTYKYQNEVAGKILSYVIDDREYQPVGAASREDTRYRVTWEHQQQVSYDTRMISEFNSQSDKDIIHDFFRSEFRNENQRENYIDITKTDPDYQMTLFISAQVDDVFNVVERLPEFRLSTRKMRVQDTPIFYTSQHSLGYLSFDHGDEVNTRGDEDYDSFRVDTFHEISYPKKYFGWLSFEPRTGLRLTGYSDDKDEDSVARGIFSAGFDTFTKISRTWDDVEDEFWGIHKLRHVIEPAVQYTFVGNPSVSPNELHQFDGLDSIRRANQFRLGLRNKLQTQRRLGTIDLIDVEFFTFYTPRHEEEDKEQAFSDVFMDFEARPIDWLKFDVNARIDTEDSNEGIEEVNTDLVYYYDDSLGLTFGQRFRKKDSNLFVFEIDFELTPDWQFKVYQRIEAESGDLQDSEFAIFRDLHDWKTVLSYRHREFRDEDSVFVVFYLKDFPDLPFKIGN